MDLINGIIIPSLPRELKFIRVLEEFEVDILTEYKAVRGAGFYLEKWCTRENKTDRYLIVRTEPRAIAEYLGKKLSMLDLLNYSSDGSGFIIDRTINELDQVFSVRLTDLPPIYLPKPSAFHDETLRPDWTHVPQDFLIDKSDWDAKLLATIERRYLDVYCFSYFTERGKNRKLPPTVFDFNYDGGFPIMHVYNKIRTLVPNQERARSVGVHAASPGLLTIEAPANTVKQISRCFNILTECEGEYENLHEWSKLSPRHYDRLPERALKDIEELALYLGINVTALFPDPTPDFEPMRQKKYILSAGKLIASYYRKLWKLLEPDEGVEFISVNITNHQTPPNSIYEEEEDEMMALI